MRQRAGIAVHAGAAAALVPGHLWLAPASRWDEGMLLAVIGALAVIAIRHDIPLPNGIRFDATAALALVAVAVAGPLPALAVIFPPIAVNALCGRERLVRPGNLANLAAYGWYTLLGAVLLDHFGPAPTGLAAFGALLLVGVAQLLVNWAVGPAVYGTLWLGHSMRALLRMLRDALPAGTAMAALGALTVMLLGSLGLLALALFAIVAVLPQSALTFAARTRPVARLDAFTAARRYAAALGVQLRLDREERRELDAVVCLAHAREYDADPVAHLYHAALDPREPSCAAGHVTEWWNGTGQPAALPGTLIPQPARIAAVAGTWAALTAGSGPRISHADAIEHLAAHAGSRFDPRIVQAARVLVRQERVTSAVPAPEPRMHCLGVPAPVRRAIAAASA